MARGAPPTTSSWSSATARAASSRFPGRGNIDETQELYCPAIMEAIAATGFEGYVGQEFRPRGDRRKAMIHAVETCDV